MTTMLPMTEQNVYHGDILFKQVEEDSMEIIAHAAFVAVIIGAVGWSIYNVIATFIDTNDTVDSSDKTLDWEQGSH